MANVQRTAGAYTTRPLTLETWDAFAGLAERHNGVWGGCWCTWFHFATHGSPAAREAAGQTADSNRDLKRRLVAEGRAHAALVFDGEEAVGWCEYGIPEEVPGIKHRKEYEATMADPPAYRLTCFFIDSRYRRQGVAKAALRGALDLIAREGGGVVESYPQDTEGKKVTASFLYNGTRTMFEEAGFTYDRPVGKNHCVMTTLVQPVA
jgi:ribosomal protein S18 acetylase RimI-like enzyme